MTVEELKIRQLTNQHLIAPSNKMTVVQDPCGVPSAVFLKCHALA